MVSRREARAFIGLQRTLYAQRQARLAELPTLIRALTGIFTLRNVPVGTNAVRYNPSVRTSSGRLAVNRRVIRTRYTTVYGDIPPPPEYVRAYALQLI